MQKDKEEKTKSSKTLPNNQIIPACCVKLWVQEMTMALWSYYNYEYIW